MRRRFKLSRLIPWIAALAIVGGVGLIVRELIELDDQAIVDNAEDVRRGDLATGRPKDPATALDILQPLLARNPDHYGALLQAAKSYADLRDWDKAIEHVELAVQSSDEARDQTSAMRAGVNYLLQADLYDEAVAMSERIVELNPDDPVFELHTGVALYKGSVFAQRAVQRRVAGGKDTSARDVMLIGKLEEYVTDIWGEPDTDALVDVLAPGAERAEREELTADLIDARARFLQASQTMAPYRHYAGFDVTVSRPYTEMLLRSGRVFEAHLESAIALRQKKIQPAVARTFLEHQAEVYATLDEFRRAADIYEQLVTETIDRQGWAPPPMLGALIEYRTEAGQWDWILAHRDEYEKLTKGDAYWRYAVSLALYATGDSEAALDALEDTFALVSLGTLLPATLRQSPERRRKILMLAFRLLDEANDSAALTALDAILTEQPDDLEARRLRVAAMQAEGLWEGARDDAFELLRRDRRDPDDFRLWLSAADELSMRRHGRGLEERARSLVDNEASLRAGAAAAAFEEAQFRRRDDSSVDVSDRFTTFLTNEPALAHYVLLARIDQHEFGQARIELRQMTETFPQVQQFRYNLGRALVREGKLEAAADVFREILADVPSDTEVLDLAMRVELARGRAEAAADLVNTMILRDPLGVGAVRYGHRLLDEGLPDQAARLFKRILKLGGESIGLDAKLIDARASLMLEEWEAAEAWVATLSLQYPAQVEVGLLALQLGLGQDKPGLIEAAVATLQPLADALFPDMMVEVCQTLVEGGLYEELLATFDPEVRLLPASRPAVPWMVQAAKAIGRFDEAEEMLYAQGDRASVRDRFLLFAMQGEPDEASRRLRLEPGHLADADEVELCQAAATALSGFRPFVDGTPTARLRQLGADATLDAERLQLLDACLRLLPSVDYLDEVMPQAVLEKPRLAYPAAGADVEALVALAQESPDVARDALTALTLLLLCDGRELWEREAQHLAELALERAPGLDFPSRRLAAAHIAADRPRDAIEVLKVVVARPDAHHEALELFMLASEDLGRPEWGVVLAMAQEDAHPGTLLLAESLVRRGRARDALREFDRYLAHHRKDKRALLGRIRAMASLKRQPEAARLSGELLELHPDDDALLPELAEILNSFQRADDEVRAVLEQIAGRMPYDMDVLETLARAYRDDADALAELLPQIVERAVANPVEVGTPEAKQRTQRFMSAAREARRVGLNDLARQLNELSLQLEPSAIIQFRELALLELQEGNLDLARRYLEVLTFVDPDDKESALSLARLLFEQIGQPHLASDVIERAYKHNMPPQAVEILASELYLRGDPAGALNLFLKVRTSPLVTPDTFLSVGRIAFASGIDDAAAASMFDLFLARAPDDHPGRARVELMRAECEVPGEEAPAGMGKGKGMGAGKQAVASPSRVDDLPAAAAKER